MDNLNQTLDLVAPSFKNHNWTAIITSSVCTEPEFSGIELDSTESNLVLFVLVELNRDSLN